MGMEFWIYGVGDSGRYTSSFIVEDVVTCFQFLYYWIFPEIQNKYTITYFADCSYCAWFVLSPEEEWREEVTLTNKNGEEVIVTNKKPNKYKRNVSLYYT